MTFALGLVLIMVAVTYGIRPYGGAPTGWASPRVLLLMAGAVTSLIAFAVIESRVAEPMFRLALFRIRAFTFGTLSTFLSAIARGGLMFMLIIWLQGIWLPAARLRLRLRRRCGPASTCFRSPSGMLLAGPTSGYLSDRFGARPFATGGMIGAAISFALLMLLPTDFSFPVFAAILFLNGISMGMFASPNRAAVMNSLPPGDRGAGGGMNQTFQNSAQVLSIGIFFTLLIIGLAATLPARRWRAACRPTACRPRQRTASARRRRSRCCSRRSSATTRSSTWSAPPCSRALPAPRAGGRSPAIPSSRT